MKTIQTFFCIYAKVYLKSKSFIFAMAMLPILTLSLIYFYNQQESTDNLFFGLHFQELTDHSSASQAIETALLTHENFQFLLYDTDDALYEDVIAGNVSAGFVFDENFSMHMQNRKINELVTVLKLENELYSKFVMQSVISAVYTELVPYIVSDYLLKKEITPDMVSIVDAIHTEKNKDTIFAVDIQVINTDTLEILDTPEITTDLSLPILKGMICIFLLFISVSFLILPSKKEIQETHALFISLLGAFKYHLLVSLPLYFFSTLTAIISLLLIHYCLNTVAVTDFNLLKEILLVLLYQLSLFIATTCIAKILKKEFIIALLPFFIVFVIVTHPVILNMSMFFPSITYLLSPFPTYLYLGFDEVQTAICCIAHGVYLFALRYLYC